MKAKVRRKTWDSPEFITARDRTIKYQFSIHNRLIDEWMPIVGVTGYALYSLYVKMANRVDERCYPGFVSIEKHFGFSRPTIVCYNWLLVQCKLIHIERFDLPDGRRYRNNYVMLPIEAVDEDMLIRLKRQVSASLSEELVLEKPNSRWVKFFRMILRRLEGWKSIQMIWAENKPSPKDRIKVVLAQKELPFVLDGDVSQGHNPGVPGIQPRCSEDTTLVSQGNNPGVPGKQEQSEDNNPKEQSEDNNPNNNSAVVVLSDVLFSRLVQVGIEEERAYSLLEVYDGIVEKQLDLLPQRLEAYKAKGQKVRSLSGLLIKSIERDWGAPVSEKEGRKDRYGGCPSCSQSFWEGGNGRCEDCGMGKECCCGCS